MTEPISIAPPLADFAGGAPKVNRRIGGLDVLRGGAALAVVVYHYGYNYQRLFHGRTGGSPLELGALGVQLFFIISGLVIFMTLEKTRRPIDFVRSRFSRLFPNYWAAIFLTFIVLTLFPFPNVHGLDYHKYHPTLFRGLLNLTMCQEMFGVGHVDAVYWTLQLELCFYIIMFLLFVTRQLPRVEFYLLAILGIGELLQHYFPSGSHLLAHRPLLALLVSDLKLLAICGPSTDPHCHLHVFLIGIMLYKLWGRFDARHVVVLLICLGFSFWREFGQYGVDFYFTLGFTLLVFAAIRGWLTPLENRATLFLGAVSYSLYLTHQNIGYVLIHAMERRHVPQLLACVMAGMAALLIAAGMTYGIEQPALRLLRAKKPVTAKAAQDALVENPAASPASVV